MATPKNYGSCSKNYINCRKHPQRSGSVEARVSADFRDYRKTVLADLKTAKEALAAVEGKENVRPGTLKRLQSDVRHQEDLKLAVAGGFSFTAWQEEMREKIAQAKTEKKSTVGLASQLRNITDDREAIFAGIKENVDKEIGFNKIAEAPPLNPFKSAVAKLLVTDGNAFDKSPDSWGDSRGAGNYQAKYHFEDNNCEPAAVENYEEDYEWSEYDTYNNEQHHGVAADVSCRCGEVYKQRFIVEADNLGSLFSRLMNFND